MLPSQPDTTETYLFNPDLEDFEFLMADENNKQQKYTMPALEISVFPKYIADHGAKHLADYLIGKRGIQKNYELDKENVYKEIYVNL